MTKHLDEIIALCEEALETDVLESDDFRIDNALAEIKDLAQQAKEDAEPSPFSALNQMTPTSVTFSGELTVDKAQIDRWKAVGEELDNKIAEKVRNEQAKKTLERLYQNTFSVGDIVQNSAGGHFTVVMTHSNGTIDVKLLGTRVVALEIPSGLFRLVTKASERGREDERKDNGK